METLLKRECVAAKTPISSLIQNPGTMDPTHDQFGLCRNLEWSLLSDATFFSFGHWSCK